MVCEVRLFEDVDRQYETVSGVLVEVDDRDIGVADILVVGVGEINCEGHVEPHGDPSGPRVDEEALVRWIEFATVKPLLILGGERNRLNHVKVNAIVGDEVHA